MNKYSLSVVFCAVDESDLLAQVYRKIAAFDLADEFVFILSKRCSAACHRTVEEICQRESKARFVTQDGIGLGNAIQCGMKQVAGTHMIVWPADDGMDTASFPKMVALSKENPEAIVKVSRWLEKGSFIAYNKIRVVINYLSQRLFALLSRAPLTDFTNPTQIAPVRVYRSIRWEYEDARMIPEMVFKPINREVRFIEEPCRDISRRSSASHVKFCILVKYYFVIFKLIAQKREKLG